MKVYAKPVNDKYWTPEDETTKRAPIKRNSDMLGANIRFMPNSKRKLKENKAAGRNTKALPTARMVMTDQGAPIVTKYRQDMIAKIEAEREAEKLVINASEVATEETLLSSAPKEHLSPYDTNPTKEEERKKQKHQEEEEDDMMRRYYSGGRLRTIDSINH